MQLPKYNNHIGGIMSDSYEILIVDDSEEQILFVSQILEDNGYTFRIARDGEEALKAIADKPPSLIILDIMMPRKTGLNVLKKMKEDPTLNAIPVIVASGASQATGVDITTGEEKPKESYGDDLARGYGELIREKLETYPPDDYLEKPVDPPVLIKKIKKLLP